MCFIVHVHVHGVCCCCYSIICPDEESVHPVTFWTVMSKVRIEAFMWVRETHDVMDSERSM